jgi:hypothetical protein
MRIKVKVIPRARLERIEEFQGGLKVYLRQPALEGRANSKLIEVLAGYFKTKKYNIRIIKGEKNREKIIEISEVS